MKIKVDLSAPFIASKLRNAAGINDTVYLSRCYFGQEINKQVTEAIRRVKLLGVPKKHLVGTSVSMCSDNKVSSGYKYKRKLEVCSIRLYPSGWYFVGFDRLEVYPDFKTAMEIRLCNEGLIEYVKACAKREGIELSGQELTIVNAYKA
jgi:hypothetical protein